MLLLDRVVAAVGIRLLIQHARCQQPIPELHHGVEALLLCQGIHQPRLAAAAEVVAVEVQQLCRQAALGGLSLRPGPPGGGGGNNMDIRLDHKALEGGGDLMGALGDGGHVVKNRPSEQLLCTTCGCCTRAFPPTRGLGDGVDCIWAQ